MEECFIFFLNLFDYMAPAFSNTVLHRRINIAQFGGHDLSYLAGLVGNGSSQSADYIQNQILTVSEPLPFILIGIGMILFAALNRK